MIYSLDGDSAAQQQCHAQHEQAEDKDDALHLQQKKIMNICTLIDTET